MTYRKARKLYGCCMCGGEIRPGWLYCDYGRGERECPRCIGKQNLIAQVGEAAYRAAFPA